MANLKHTLANIPRIEHLGLVVVPAAVLAKRRTERAELRRRAEAAAGTIMGQGAREPAAGS